MLQTWHDELADRLEEAADALRDGRANVTTCVQDISGAPEEPIRIHMELELDYTP